MYLYIKRLFDIIFASIVIIILIPFMLPIVILLLFSKEGYVFYKQKRMGFKNKEFLIWKFATMLKDSPNIGTGSITLRNDPRVTHVGKFLRISKINELPQLLNILFGDMSIVGPRPLMTSGFFKYNEDVQSKIYSVKPGLTGIGSVIFRDEEKLVSEADISPEEYYAKFIFPYKGKLELWYLQNISFFTDVKIIFMTAFSILFPKNNLASKIFKGLPLREF